jgi:hypothetical protein
MATRWHWTVGEETRKVVELLGMVLKEMWWWFFAHLWQVWSRSRTVAGLVDISQGSHLSSSWSGTRGFQVTCFGESTL